MKIGLFTLFSRKIHFLFSNTKCILKKVINQTVPVCKDIETTASQLPKLHEIYSHWLWKSLVTFKTIF